MKRTNKHTRSQNTAMVKKMGLYLPFFFIMLLSLGAYAERADSYIFTRTTGTYTSIVGDPSTIATTDISSDDVDMEVPLGFNFRYCGRQSSIVQVSSNGEVALKNDAYSFWFYPDSTRFGAGKLCPFWRDGLGTGKTAYYQTVGAPGSRVFTFEWNDWAIYGLCCTKMNFQIKLYEGTNIIRFCYGSKNFNFNWSAVGITNGPTDYQCLSGPSATSTSSTRWYYHCDMPDSGSIITWTSPCEYYHLTPAVVSVTGGGGYCAGGTGLNIGVAGSAVGVNYQLYRNNVAIGSPVAGVGSGLSFGLQTIAGTYTATATNTTPGCTSAMSGSATVYVYPTPIRYLVTGGGDYCVENPGLPVALVNSDIGVKYQLYRNGSPIFGSAIMGTGGPVSFGLQSVLGVYTIRGTVTGFTGCSATMLGNATVTPHVVPTSYAVTGGGPVCAGGTGRVIGLSGSEIGLIYYQLYRNSVPTGLAILGSGGAISFPLQNLPGTYTVIATMPSGCTGAMAGSATISTTPPPTAYDVTGGGGYCSGGTGVAVGLTTSQTWVSYQLMRGIFSIGAPVTGTGSPISFGLQTVAGTYTVVGTGTGGCATTMTRNAIVSINTLPTNYLVTGGGAYCPGSPAPLVTLSGSDIGTTYQLYKNGLPLAGTTLPGTGAALSYGSQTAAGTYTIVAKTTAGCTATMPGAAVVVVNTMPAVFTVTGGGSYCAGGAGVVIGLSGTQNTWVYYQLYRGTTPIGAPVLGLGGTLSFPPETVPGTYKVAATILAGCTASMAGSATIVSTSPPLAYTVTGGGSYCAGGTGVVVGISGSQAGVSYQLYNGGTATGSPKSGTGGALSFGKQTIAGTYTVTGTGGCPNTMSGSVTVVVNPLPNAYTVTGGGSACSGGAGVSIGLSGSDAGVTYKLYRGSTLVGSPVAGTGGAVSFGAQSVNGTYSIVAINTVTGCTRNMNGSAIVAIGSLPAIVAVTGGGGYCSGGVGVRVGLAGSAVGINYQLYRGGTAIGAPMPGAGTSIDFGMQTIAGTYTAVASNGAGCTSNMSGSATVYVYTLPSVYTITGGGGYCAGGTGVRIGLSGSNSGVSYRLFRNGTPVYTMTGTGTVIDFGLFATTGTYTVVATNSSGCAIPMTGSVAVSIDPNPTVSGSIYTVAPGSNITLTPSISGGTWSSGAPSYATVDATSGVVTGVSLGTAVMTYTAATGCYGVRIIYVTATGHREAPQGIPEPAKELTIYPNPNHGEFTIRGAVSTDQGEETISLTATDVLGKVVFQTTVMATNGAIDEQVRFTNPMVSGMYLLIVRSAKEEKVFRVMVER